MTKFITSNTNYVWVLLDDRQYILQYSDLPIIERVGKGWKFVLQTVFPIHDEIVDMIHDNNLAVCHTEHGRPDLFVEEDVIVCFANCVEIDRKILAISKMSGENKLVVMETTFISGKVTCIT